MLVYRILMYFLSILFEDKQNVKSSGTEICLNCTRRRENNLQNIPTVLLYYDLHAVEHDRSFLCLKLTRDTKYILCPSILFKKFKTVHTWIFNLWVFIGIYHGSRLVGIVINLSNSSDVNICIAVLHATPTGWGEWGRVSQRGT